MPIGIFPWFNNIWKNLKIMHNIFTDLFSFEVLKLILGEGISDAYESFFNIFNIKFNILSFKTVLLSSESTTFLLFVFKASFIFYLNYEFPCILK